MTYATILKIILEMSVTASILAIVVMILRKAAKRALPKSCIFALWIVVIAKLLIPLSLPSPTSLYNIVDVDEMTFIEVSDNGTFEELPNISGNSGVIPSVPQGNIDSQPPSVEAEIVTPEKPNVTPIIPENNVPAGENPPLGSNDRMNYADVKDISVEIGRKIFNTAGAVYCGVTAAVAVAIISIYAYTAHRIGKSETVEDERVRGIMKELKCGEKVNLRLLRGNRSIMIFGILHPTVILPEDYESLREHELRYLLMHEMEHYYHKDPLWNLLMIVSVCVHWFNPIVWLSYRLFLHDMETACDARVLGKLSDAEKHSFAGVLLTFASRSIKGNTIATMGFCKNNIKDRLLSAVKFKKTGVIAIVASVLVVVITISVFATGEVNVKADSEVAVDTNTSETELTEPMENEPDESESEPVETEPEITNDVTEPEETEPAETEPAETEEVTDTPVTEPAPTKIVAPTEIFATVNTINDTVNSVGETFKESDDLSHRLTVYFNDISDVALVFTLERSDYSATGVKATVTGAYNYGNYYDLCFSDSLLTGNLHIVNTDEGTAVGMIGNLGSYYILKDGLCSPLLETDEYGYYLWAQNGELYYVKRNSVFEYANDSMDEFAKGFESGTQFYMSTGTIDVDIYGTVSLNESCSYATYQWFESENFVMAKEREEYLYIDVTTFVKDYLGEGLHEQLYIDQEKLEQSLKDLFEKNHGGMYGYNPTSIVEDKNYSVEGPISVTIPVSGPANPPQALFNYNSSQSSSSRWKSSLPDPWAKPTINFVDPNPNK